MIIWWVSLLSLFVLSLLIIPLPFTDSRPGQSGDHGPERTADGQFLAPVQGQQLHDGQAVR